MTTDDSHTQGTAASATHDLASEAKDQAARLTGSVKDEVTRREQDLRAGLADRVESVAAGLRKAGSEIDPTSPVAAMFDRAADSVSSAAGSLTATDPAQMVADMRSFARRQPGAFLGLSALAGFAAIRFLRAGATPSMPPANTSGFGTSEMTRRAPSGDNAQVSPAGAASTSATSDPARPVPTGASPVSGGPVPGGRSNGGTHA